ncbi:major facilitator superfamily transporter [Globomyces pollinis-pini]|nr:major facilitator superfamily transporter [Globomyces pollinis-pini]
MTDLFNRLDKLTWSSWHTFTSFVLGTGWAMDAFETSIVSANIAYISEDFNITDPFQQSLITSVWNAGGLVGALLFGYLGDRFGRKFTFVFSLIMYSAFTLITSFSPSFLFFLILRACTAIGVAAEYSAVTSSVSEFLPMANRGQVTALIQGTWSIGAILASAVNVLIIPMFSTHLGWRVAFSLGAVAALFALWARKNIPESPRWLVNRNQLEKAESIVRQIEIDAKQPDNNINVEQSPYLVHEHENLFSQVAGLVFNHPFRTLFCSLLDASQAFGGYGVSSFMSVCVFKLVDFPKDQIALFYFVGNLFTIPGTLVTFFLIEKIDRKIMLPLGYSLAAVSAVLLAPAALSGNLTWVWVAYCFYQFGYTMAWNIGYPMYAEIFPTRYRATGIGFSVAVGRTAGFAAPLLLETVYSSGNGQNILGATLLLAGLFLSAVVASIPWAIYGVEARGKSLEDLFDEKL